MNYTFRILIFILAVLVVYILRKGNLSEKKTSLLLSSIKPLLRIFMCQLWSVQISKARITNDFTAVIEYKFEVKKKKY